MAGPWHVVSGKDEIEERNQAARVNGYLLVVGILKCRE
jgi:hypothetical protein